MMSGIESGLISVMKMTLMIMALLGLFLLSGCTRHAEKPPATQPAMDDASATRFTGTLQGGMMAIGGETTGWMLQREGQGQLEVDVSRIFNEARKLQGQRVTIEGKVVQKQYVERGPTPVLVAERISAAR